MQFKKKSRTQETKQQNLTLSLKFTRNSILIVTSNVEMEVPPFITFTEHRSLMTVSNLNVNRDLFDIEIDFYGVDAQEKIEYSVSLTNWTGSQIDLFLNFSDPELVSKGLQLDKAILKVIDPEMIKSAKYGSAVDNSSKEILALMPKQMPSFFDL